MVVGMGRQPPAVPAGTAVPVVPGLEDEDEDEDENEKSAPPPRQAQPDHSRGTGPPCPVTGTAFDKA
ncbi:MAG: hypothetical protein GX174_11215 [Lentisphaerae bacterium]|nr:hypothetical protein [Lentisphaerota bacterium]